MIESPLISSTGLACEMRFSYRATTPSSTDSPPALSVIISDNLNYKRIYATDTVSNDWQTISVRLPFLNQTIIKIWVQNEKAKQENGDYVDVEIDNIRMVNCGSNDTSQSINSQLNCSFEGSSCAWVDIDTDYFDKLDWNLAESKLAGVFYNPPPPGYDHTSMIRPRQLKSGGFMYVNSTKVKQGTATLISVNKINSTSICLSFWYHLFGTDNLTFEVVTNIQFTDSGIQRFWLRKIPHNNAWTQAQVTIKMNQPYYLMFRTKLEPNTIDSVALDDVSVIDGVCEETTSTCDFEV